MALYSQMFENNKQWVEETKAATGNDFFVQLAKGQNPDILYIGCSDSRVNPSALTGTIPGEMFVHRNIANLVPLDDPNSAAVLDYAITHLHVKHIVVCGHYYCGGIQAAMKPEEPGVLDSWLNHIRDVYESHEEELDALNDPTERYRQLVELNIAAQCHNIMSMPVWQEAYLATGMPEMHGCVFDVRSGELIDLHLDFQDIIDSLQA